MVLNRGILNFPGKYLNALSTEIIVNLFEAIWIAVSSNLGPARSIRNCLDAFWQKVYSVNGKDYCQQIPRKFLIGVSLLAEQDYGNKIELSKRYYCLFKQSAIKINAEADFREKKINMLKIT